MSRKTERLSQLLDILKERNGSSVKELAETLSVSEMTIRRDLKILNSMELVHNFYGGTAITSKENSIEAFDRKYSLLDAKIEMSEEKAKIGNYAASLVEEDDIIIIDIGSTTEYMAASLSPSLRATVICCTFNTMQHLNNNSNLKIILPGGYYHNNTQMYESVEGVSLMRNLRAKKAFISAAGVHKTLGITCANSYELETKKAIIDSGAEKILLVDSSKLGQVQSSYFAQLNIFDKIITDSGINDDYKSHLRNLGIDLHIL